MKKKNKMDQYLYTTNHVITMDSWSVDSFHENLKIVRIDNFEVLRPNYSLVALNRKSEKGTSWFSMYYDLGRGSLAKNRLFESFSF